MDDLLPHYERELAFLRTRASDFARQYPKIAGRLQLSGDVGDDPHVERLIEAFAFLSARIHKRLDDDFPLFTEALLEVLYPHYLRPFPSCAIARFDLGLQAAQLAQSVTVTRGTTLSSRSVKGVICRFRTTSDLRLLPIEVTSVTHRHSVQAPAGSSLPPGVTSVLCITLSKRSPQMSWASILSDPWRVHLDGESSQVAVLRDAMCLHTKGVRFAWHPDLPWHLPAQVDAVPQPAGFTDGEALIEWDDRAHPAYRLLTEYFGFPDKFNFVDLPAARGPDGHSHADLTADVVASEPGQVSCHLLLSGLRADSDQARLLETVTASNVVLGAVPVINLFPHAADPIRVTHRQTEYPVVVDGRRAHGHEVHSLLRVHRVRQTPHGDVVDEVKPFFSLQHDDLLDALGKSGADAGEAHCLAYWQMRRDEDLAERSPGHEVSISLVDAQHNPMTPAVETLSLDVMATNRDLPHLLAPGTVGGDLFMEGGGPARSIALLRKPTRSHRVERGKGLLWRLISQLSLNHLSLSGGGLDAFKELLRLYDSPHSATNRRQIDGLVSIDFLPDTAWIPGQPFASFVRGTLVKLTVDEDSFVGSGMGLFAQVMDCFFGLYVHANSYSRLQILSARSGAVLMNHPPRHGERQLL
jgi:type VI secretion system protein ImpG